MLIVCSVLLLYSILFVMNVAHILITALHNCVCLMSVWGNLLPWIPTSPTPQTTTTTNSRLYLLLKHRRQPNKYVLANLETVQQWCSHSGVRIMHKLSSSTGFLFVNFALLLEHFMLWVSCLITRNVNRISVDIPNLWWNGSVFTEALDPESLSQNVNTFYVCMLSRTM